MSVCTGCGFWDSDYEACTCPSYEMWYACPIESERPENKKAMEEYIKEMEEKEKRKNDTSNY